MDDSRRPNLPLRLCALLALAIGLACSAGASPAMSAGSQAPAPGLLLWNKLGSDQEVTNSEYGPNLVMFNCTDFPFGCGLDVPGTLAYPAGVFGGGASITGGYFSGARIHTAVLRDAILNPEHGAIEAWYRQDSDPLPYQHNPHRIFGGPYSLTGIDEVNLYSRDAFDSGDPRLHFDLFFDVEPPPFTPAHLVGAHSLVDGGDGYPISQYNGSWIHVAGVWDRNGIDGTADTIRLYVNGDVVAASQQTDWGSTTCDHRLPGQDRCFVDVDGCNDTCGDTFAEDNLKVWDHAKTNYSDRFQEGFGNESPDCAHVTATPRSIFPATRLMALITLSGAADPNGDALSYHIDGVTQDEYVTGIGDNTSPDAALTPSGANSNQVLVRSEANSRFGDGRVYRIAYTVSDGNGATCSGTAGPGGTTTAKVGIQRARGISALDDGDSASWNSFTGARLP
jgi:hypothetical protein